MRYDSPTTLFGGRLTESFAAGSFENLSSPEIVCNVMHCRERILARNGQAMTLEDGPTELRISVDLPTTREGEDAAELVRSGVMRGWSVEFVSRRSVDKAGVRHVTRALLGAVSLVDSPAYRQTNVTAGRPSSRLRLPLGAF